MSIQSTFPVLRLCVDIYKEIIQYYLLLYFFLEKYETEEMSMILAYGYSTSAQQNLVKLFAGYVECVEVVHLGAAFLDHFFFIL